MTGSEPMFGQILCPTDFGVLSKRALELGARLGRTHGSRIHLIHVVQPIPVIAPPAPHVAAGHATDLHSAEVLATQDWLIDVSRERLEQARQELTRELETSLQVLVGNPGEEITRYAEMHAIDLIVTASHGQGRWRKFLFGSVADKVIRLSSCPVLVVPPAVDDEKAD